jgi:membrane protein YdbS with pleckstrin-like domain
VWVCKNERKRKNKSTNAALRIEGCEVTSVVSEHWQQINAPESQLTGGDFRQLDLRVVRLWRVTYLISFGVLLAVLLPGLIPIGLNYPWLWWWLVAGWLVLAAICVWFSFWRPPRVFRSWSWRIDAKVLEIRTGLMFQRTRLLPLPRLQHVDLERGPLERHFGLASLVLHTAGTHSANITIPGLDANEAARLRDHLVEIGGDDAV